MLSFAIYRLPHESSCTLVEQMEGEPLELISCAELNGRQGFVLAPFEVTTEQPILLIRPDRVRRMRYEDVEKMGITDALPMSHPFRTSFSQSNKASYAIDFANFHSQLQQGAFRKIVLARCAAEPSDGRTTPIELFRKACQCYPRMFISLVYTTKSGWWLTATPEILLEGEANQWRTIALAGTMKLEGDDLRGEGETLRWSTKNIQEQRMVATYIAECLEQFTADFTEEGPYTVRAANLVHLRTDFTFILPDSNRIGDLLLLLHPTPAVCGLPKRDAFRFIVKNEQSPRRYYSGFMGPLGLSPGTAQSSHPQTHLFVSLRCMNIMPELYCLYAGGGLLKDSTEEQEWMETEAKLETMRRLLNCKS